METGDKNFPTRKRRTNAEIAASLKKERRKLYRVRSNALKEVNNDKTPKRKKDVLQRKLDRVSKKITTINIRLVKSSVRWDNFKKNKKKIRSKINTLKKDIYSGELSDKEINRKLHEIRDFSNQIKLLEGDIYEKYLGEAILPKGERIQINLFGGDIVEQYLVIWELKDKIKDAISTEMFDTINIEGDIISVIDYGSVMMDIDVFIAEITDKQHLTETPMVVLIFDFKGRGMLVYNNTSSLQS